jgi:hypothetical protein
MRKLARLALMDVGPMIAAQVGSVLRAERHMTKAQGRKEATSRPCIQGRRVKVDTRSVQLLDLVVREKEIVGSLEEQRCLVTVLSKAQLDINAQNSIA